MNLIREKANAGKRRMNEVQQDWLTAHVPVIITHQFTASTGQLHFPITPRLYSFDKTSICQSYSGLSQK
jgi:hypothetical protein